MSISDILVIFHKHEPSFMISNDGYSNYAYDLGHDDYYDEQFHDIQYGFFPFIWKNSLFLVTFNGNIYRLTNKGKL